MNSRKNKAESGLLVVLILVALAAGAYFAIPSFKTWVTEQWTKVKGWWNTNYGSYFTLEITYADGTKHLYEPSGLGTLALIDINSGQAVTSAFITLYYTADFTGTVTSFTGSTAYAFQRFEGQSALSGTETTIASGTITIPDTGAITSGQRKAGWQTAYQASALEANLPSSETEYILRWILTQPLSLTLTFSDGTSQTKSTGQGMTLDWHVKKTSPNGFNSLSISWGRL